MAALASDWLRHFRLLLWNQLTEFNETWQEARSQCPLQSLCFSGQSEKQDGRPGLWLAETFSTSPLKPLNGIQQNLTGSKVSTLSTTFVFFRPIGKTRWPPWPLIGWDIFDFSSETAEQNSTWQEARSQRSLPSVCFSGRSEKQDGRPCLWLAETFPSSPLELLNGIQRNLTGSKISTSSTKFVFFGPIGKTRWPPWLLIGWGILNFSSETAERNSTKLDRKQDLNVLYQVGVFRVDWKNKMTALASNLLRHFWLLLWNRWTELNETWQEARSQRSLPSLCFSDWLEKQDGRPGLWLAETFSTSPLKPLSRILAISRSEKQDGRPGLWLAETFSTSPLKPLNGIQRNLTGSKTATSSTKFVFFRPIEKTRWPPWPLIGWDISDFSSETAEGNSTKLDRKEDLNVLFQRRTKFVFFGPIGKTRWPSWPLIGWDISDFSSETAERNSTKLYRKQDLNVFYQVCVFRVDWKNKMAALASDWMRHFWLLLWNRWTELNETWQEARSQRSLPSLCFSGRSEKQDGRLGLWLAETFLTSPLKPLKGIQRNLTGSKIATSSTKFVFFGPIGKTRWPP